MLFMNGWDGMRFPSAQLFGLSGRFSALWAGSWVIMHIYLVVAHLSDVDREDPPDLHQLLAIGDINHRRYKLRDVRPAHLAELSRSGIDPELFSNSVYVKFFCDIRDRSAEFNILQQNDTFFYSGNG